MLARVRGWVPSVGPLLLVVHRDSATDLLALSRVIEAEAPVGSRCVA